MELADQEICAILGKQIYSRMAAHHITNAAVLAVQLQVKQPRPCKQLPVLLQQLHLNIVTHNLAIGVCLILAVVISSHAALRMSTVARIPT